MITQTFRAAFCTVLVPLAGAVWSQESESDAASAVGESDAPPASIEKCFSVPAVIDMNVLNDAHVYVQTRGGNHYLMSTAQCPNLERSYRRGAARLVPYGRTVCESDGSHLVYDAGGRERPCTITTIERVGDRAEARSLAESNRPLVDVEETAPVD